MAHDRDQLKLFVLEAVLSKPDGISWVDCAKYIWEHRRSDLEKLGDVFFTWQYDMRWAMQVLRDEGRVKNVGRGRWGIS